MTMTSDDYDDNYEHEHDEDDEGGHVQGFERESGREGRSTDEMPY